MTRAQYLCVKAIHNEVDGLHRDGWRTVVKTHDPNMGLQYYLRHDWNGHISIQSNANLTRFSIYKNGKLRKCQNFDASI